MKAGDRFYATTLKFSIRVIHVEKTWAEIVKDEHQVKRQSLWQGKFPFPVEEVK